MYIYKSVNPATNKLYRTFDTITTHELAEVVVKSYNCFMYNQAAGIQLLSSKNKKLGKLANILEERKSEFSSLITRETGKLKQEADDEIVKCIGHLKFMIEKGPSFLKDEEYRL